MIVSLNEDETTMIRNNPDGSSEEEGQLRPSDGAFKVQPHPFEMRRRLDRQHILAELSQIPHYGLEKTNRVDFFRDSDGESEMENDDSMQEAEYGTSEDDDVLDTNTSIINIGDKELEKQRMIDELREIERDER